MRCCDIRIVAYVVGVGLIILVLVGVPLAGTPTGVDDRGRRDRRSAARLRSTSSIYFSRSTWRAEFKPESVSHLAGYGRGNGPVSFLSSAERKVITHYVMAARPDGKTSRR